jgi:ribosomal protein L40E
MTYKKNFVAVIKVNGQVLRESNDTVELPFGAEYSVLLKNLDSVRMQARISVDGKDATGWLIIGPGQAIDVERFIENLEIGNRFKFIERSEAVEAHRGVKPEDGLIRVEFKREKIYPVITFPYVWLNQYYSYPYVGPIITCNGFSSGNITRSAQCLNATATSQSGQNTQSAVQNVNNTCNTGITVPGSLSEQKFVTVSDFQCDQSEVLVLHLVGKIAGKSVKVAKTVRKKLVCETCNTKNVSSAKFCWQCGTSLERV